MKAFSRSLSLMLCLCLIPLCAVFAESSVLEAAPADTEKDAEELMEAASEATDGMIAEPPADPADTEGIQGIFVPEVFVPEVNAWRELLIQHMAEEEGYDEETMTYLQDALTLYYDETIEYIIYCNNEDQSIEMAFAYSSADQAGLDKQADTFALSIADNINRSFRDVVATSMVMAMGLHDPDLDLMAVATFMDQGVFEGETYPLFDGYVLCLAHMPDGHYQYAVIHAPET